MLTRAFAALSTTALATGMLAGFTLPASAAEVLPAPTGLVVSKVGNHTVWLDWDDVAGAERYVIYYNPVSDPGAEKKTYTVKSDAPPSERVISTAALLNGVDYEFEVAAQDINSGTATSPKSTAVYATPISPAVPADFRVEYVGNERVYFEWNAVPLAQGYYISTEVYDDNGIGNAKVPAVKFFSTAAKEQAEYVSGLTNGVTYRFRIATRMDNQAGDYSADQDAPLGTPLAVPGSPNVTKKTVNKSAITVNLTKPAAQAGVPDADKYRVFFTPNLGEPIVVDTNTTTATASNLLEGMTYSITAQAGNANGYGPYDFTPLVLVAADKPGAVVSPSVVREEDGSVAVLTWDAPKYSGGAQRPNYYNISVNPLDPQDYDPPNQRVTDPRAVFAGLTQDGDYTFGITATTDGGTGPMVLTGSLAAAPGAGAVEYDNSTGNATFAFTPNSDPYLDYQVQARQLVTVASSALKAAKRDGLLAQLGTNSEHTITPASLDCSATTCLATFPKFADNINGTAWDFRVRAYDNLYSASNWESGQLPAIANVATSTQVDTTPSISCPEGTLIDSQCLLPDGSISRTPAQVFTTHEVGTTFPWTTRESQGVVNFFVNGQAYAGQPVSLGRCPGTVSLEFTGLAGSSSSSTELCSQSASLPGPVGDLEATATGTTVNLTWSKPSIGQVPITGYTVSWVQAGVKKTQTTTITSASVSGLTAGSSYTFMVAANTTYGPSTGVGTDVSVEAGEAYNAAVGGVEQVFTLDGKTYRSHSFYSGQDSLTITSASRPFYVLVVAGGGGGGPAGNYSGSGGGGAGGVINKMVNLSTGSLPVSVGAGSSGRGQDSVFADFTAVGGGAGGGVNGSGSNGGSGGGGGGVHDQNPGAGGSGVTGQGYSGAPGFGSSKGQYQPGGGGGGAAAPGSGTVGGSGIEFLYLDGTSRFFGGGGGAGGAQYGAGGAGGVGGGGRGGQVGVSAGTAGEPNTGGGGGGGSGTNGPVIGPGPGGSGLVVVAYEILP